MAASREGAGAERTRGSRGAWLASDLRLDSTLRHAPNSQPCARQNRVSLITFAGVHSWIEGRLNAQQ